MKDFAYHDNNKINLHIFAARWLRKLGFKETQWFLDATWLMSQHEISFKKWIDE